MGEAAFHPGACSLMRDDGREAEMINDAGAQHEQGSGDVNRGRKTRSPATPAAGAQKASTAQGAIAPTAFTPKPASTNCSALSDCSCMAAEDQ